MEVKEARASWRPRSATVHESERCQPEPQIRRWIFHFLLFFLILVWHFSSFSLSGTLRFLPDGLQGGASAYNENTTRVTARHSKQNNVFSPNKRWVWRNRGSKKKNQAAKSDIEKLLWHFSCLCFHRISRTATMKGRASPVMRAECLNRCFTGGGLSLEVEY